MLCRSSRRWWRRPSTLTAAASAAAAAAEQRCQSFASLVVAEHTNEHLLAPTMHAVAAAAALDGQAGQDVHVLVSGKECQKAAELAATVNGVTKVVQIEHEGLQQSATHPESVSDALVGLLRQRSGEYTHVLTAGNAFGKSFMPRVAALMDTAMVSDVIKVLDERTFVRPIYAGDALQTVRYSEEDGLRILTIRMASFSPADKSPSHKADIELVSLASKYDQAYARSLWIHEEKTKSERPQLNSARVVVSGGRGLKNSENFDTIMTPLADKLGAAIGATRAAVDSGFCRNELQVGQTGTIVAPELYVAVGVSGAVQHLAGMKDSKCIVAVNKDEDAPIFHVADYGIVGDLFQVVPELVEKLPAPSS